MKIKTKLFQATINFFQFIIFSTKFCPVLHHSIVKIILISFVYVLCNQISVLKKHVTEGNRNFGQLHALLAALVLKKLPTPRRH